MFAATLDATFITYCSFFDNLQTTFDTRLIVPDGFHEQVDYLMLSLIRMREAQRKTHLMHLIDNLAPEKDAASIRRNYFEPD